MAHNFRNHLPAPVITTVYPWTPNKFCGSRCAILSSQGLENHAKCGLLTTVPGFLCPGNVKLCDDVGCLKAITYLPLSTYTTCRLTPLNFLSRMQHAGPGPRGDTVPVIEPATRSDRLYMSGHSFRRNIDTDFTADKFFSAIHHHHSV